MTTNPEDEILFSIKVKDVKRWLYTFFNFLVVTHIFIDSYMAPFWSKIFFFSSRLQTLSTNKYVRLLPTTILFSSIGSFFGGLIGILLYYAVFLNVIAILVERTGWLEKLKS